MKALKHPMDCEHPNWGVPFSFREIPGARQSFEFEACIDCGIVRMVGRK